jgi:shikimate kinase
MTQLKSEIILMIGMSGAGKTTVGTLLAKKLGYSIIDTDDVIETTLTHPIQTYIDEHGDEALLALEEKTLINLPLSEKTVISPGGSIVYSEPVMKRFKEKSLIIYLYDSCSRIKNRIPDLETRGIIGSKSKTFEAIYEERAPLYEQYADFIINCSQFSSFEEITTFIISQLELLCLNEQ